MRRSKEDVKVILDHCGFGSMDINRFYGCYVWIMEHREELGLEGFDIYDGFYWHNDDLLFFRDYGFTKRAYCAKRMMKMKEVPSWVDTIPYDRKVMKALEKELDYHEPKILQRYLMVMMRIGFKRRGKVSKETFLNQ